MGAGISKEEQLFQAVQNGNHQLVKSLRRDGASLEWIDKEGRTPLIFACTHGELFDMVVTLLNLGANLNAYRPGSNGGFPLHHAAKRGLEKTVILLLSRGADPLAINDDSQTPLDMARARGNVPIVRIIEDRICLFRGMLREVSGPGLLEVLMPHWVTKKVWVVVLPVDFNPRRPQRHELLIYNSPKAPQPKTVMSLWKADLEEPKWDQMTTPFLLITDKTSRTKYKLLPETDGDKAQLDRLYKSCRGIPPVTSAPGYPLPHHPTAPQDMGAAISEDVALAMAIDASLQSPADSHTPADVPNNGWGGDGGEHDYNGWGTGSGASGAQKQSEKKSEKKTSGDYGGWGAEESSSSSSWQPTSSANNLPSVGSGGNTTANNTTAETVAASAPPLPEYEMGPIHYPSIDTSPVEMGGTQEEEEKGGGGSGSSGTCVVCWDAKAEGVCIPCGHLAGCMSCLEEIKKKKWGCPVCRGRIDQVVKVFAV